MGMLPVQATTGVIPYIPVEIMMMGQFAKVNPPQAKLSAGWEQSGGKLMYRWRQPRV